MLIINKQILNVGEALQNNLHPQHKQAVEYDRGMKELWSLYPEGFLKIRRTGYPHLVDGIDDKGRDLRDIPEPTPPVKFPLSTLHTATGRGKELWACCMGEPKILPGNLFDIGEKRSFEIKDNLVINMTEDPDFAYYVYFLSRAKKGGHIVVDDPKKDARKRGDKRRQALERETAIWGGSLSDVNQLRKIASAYGVAEVDTLEPDIIREELERVLQHNDEMKRRDPSYKGTTEFLDELKITDFVRLSAFIRHWMDEQKIVFHKDGRYMIGEKVLAHVPYDQADKKFQWLCNFYAAPNNAEKLKELMLDLVNKDYLKTINDDKEWRWMAKVMDVSGYYNQSPEIVQNMVCSTFNIVLSGQEPVEVEVDVEPEKTVKKTAKK